MKQKCLRCNTIFSQKSKRINNNTFTCIESESNKYIRETYNNCICDKCEKEINVNYYSYGINPKYLKQTE